MMITKENKDVQDLKDLFFFWKNKTYFTLGIVPANGNKDDELLAFLKHIHNTVSVNTNYLKAEFAASSIQQTWQKAYVRNLSLGEDPMPVTCNQEMMHTGKDTV